MVPIYSETALIGLFAVISAHVDWHASLERLSFDTFLESAGAKAARVHAKRYDNGGEFRTFIGSYTDKVSAACQRKTGLSAFQIAFAFQYPF